MSMFYMTFFSCEKIFRQKLHFLRKNQPCPRLLKNKSEHIVGYQNSEGLQFMQLTTLIGKQVLTPAGEKLGYVLAVNPARDMKGIACFLCADEDEEEFYLPARNVLSYSDALIANRSRSSSPTGIPCPLGKTVFSHTGGFLGTLGELLVGDGADPLFIVHGEGAKLTLPLSRVSIGDALIVYPEGRHKPAPVRSAPKKKPAPKPAAKPAPAEVEEEPARVEPAQPRSFHPEDALNRVNLLGKKLKKTVYDENGYPIAEAGVRITETIVARARRSNRLLQLTVNTLTNVL